MVARHFTTASAIGHPQCPPHMRRSLLLLWLLLGCATTTTRPYVKTTGPNSYWNSHCDLRTRICMMAADTAANGRIVFQVGSVVLAAPRDTTRRTVTHSADTNAIDTTPVLKKPNSRG